MVVVKACESTDPSAIVKKKGLQTCPLFLSSLVAQEELFETCTNHCCSDTSIKPPYVGQVTTAGVLVPLVSMVATVVHPPRQLDYHCLARKGPS